MVILLYLVFVLLQYLILFNRVFLRGNYNTSFIEKEQESLLELLRTATDIRGK